MILYERTKMSAEVEMFNSPSKTQPSTRSQRRGESVLQNRSVAAQSGGASTLLVQRPRERPMRIDGRDRQVQRVGEQYVSRLWRFSHPRWWSGLWQAVNHLSLPRKHYGPAVLIFLWTG